MIKKRRWGILILAVLMFLITLMFNPIVSAGKQNANPLYLFAWIMVGWYAIKGDLDSIKSWMKWTILISFFGIIFLSIFVGDEYGITTDSKQKIIFLNSVFFVPKILLWYYCNFQNKLNAAEKNQSSNTTEEITPNADNKKNSLVNIPPEALMQPQIISEEETNNLYSFALEEAQGGERNKGLWARCFAQSDGNNDKAIAKYIEERFNQLKKNLEKEKVIESYSNYIEKLKLKSIQNDSEATYELANIIYNGIYNQSKDVEKAFEIMMKAAYMGNPKAQHSLSSMYWKGDGTNPSKSNAHAWAVMASSQIVDAKSNVAFFQKQMRTEEIYESDDLIRVIKKNSNQ